MRSLIIVALIAFVGVSCSSSEDPDPVNEVNIPSDQADALLALNGTNMKSWVTKRFTLAGVQLDCRADDVIMLHADGTFDYDGGDNLCGLQDNARTRTGTWELDLENRTFTVELNTGVIYSGEFQKITENELIMTGNWGGMSIRATFVPSES